MDMYNYEAMQLAKKACWRRPPAKTANLSPSGTLSPGRQVADDLRIERHFPRKIYLREPGELTQQLVSIASGGKSYESSHNCYYGRPASKQMEDDDDMVNQGDTSRPSPKTPK